ncbi:MAG TPA: type II secretion system protein GspL [Marinagarivorans sp.]
MAEKILVRKVATGLWQWRQVTASQLWASDAFYTGDINLLAESVAGKTCWLILDGRHVVTQRVDVGVKDRKVLTKLVPFEVEESVVTPIDNLTFAYGPLVDGEVDTAYTDEANTAEEIAELEELGAEVPSAVCDYLELDAGDGWVLLLDEQTLYAKYGSHRGFSCDADNAELFILALCETHKGDDKTTLLPPAIHLVADGEESLARLRGYLPEFVESAEGVSIYEQEGGFWDVLKLGAKPVLDFRTGNLARKLPFGQWWNEWKVPAIAAAAAFVIAAGVTWGELHQAKKASQQLFADRDAVYRQVVSSGSITDPVRQLKAKLGTEKDTEPSNVVLLVSKVAPQIRANNDLKVTSFRYTQNNGALQFNVESKDFAMLEALRGKIAETGLTAEIKSSRASGDIHQAQIRVTES